MGYRAHVCTTYRVQYGTGCFSAGACDAVNRLLENYEYPDGDGGRKSLVEYCDAEETVMELSRFPRGRLHLVVNRVRGKLLRSMHATIDDAIDTAGLPLLGVIPEDGTLPLAQSRGAALLLVSTAGASAAYRNIARRITGARVPLLRLR